MKYICSVGARDLGMKPKIIDDQTMQRILECRVRFRYCGSSFPSPEMYMSVLKKKVEMSGSVFRFSSHYRNASTNDVHLP